MEQIKNIKKRVNFNISINTLKEFNLLAKERAINKSQLIENYIKEWMEKNK
jgi:hypothetical protein